MAARLAVIILTTLAAVALAPAKSVADGDPASDVLLGENVFYPYTPPVALATQKALNRETAAAKRAGFPIKVALIGSPIDLGVVPGLFGKPQKYADFLDQEISFRGKQPLLVVMAAGYGTQGLPTAVNGVSAALPKPAGTASNDLASAAITAVGRLASASGHPLENSSGTSSAGGGGSSTTTILLVVLIVAAVTTAGGLVFVRRRQAPAR